MFCVRNVVDLFLDRHRQSKIVFYAGFSPALEVQKSVRILHFTNFLTVHQKNLDQIYFISGVLSDRYEYYSKEYSCLSNYGHTHACDNYYTNMYIISHLI